MRTQASYSSSTLPTSQKETVPSSTSTWQGRGIAKCSKDTSQPLSTFVAHHILGACLPQDVCAILDTYKFNPHKIIRKLCGKIEKAPLFLQSKLQTIGYTVTALDLHDLKLTSEHIKHIVRYFPNLMEINANNSNLDDSCMEELAKLTKLRKLNLTGCSRLTDAGIAKLKPLTELVSLDLTACLLLTKRACETIALFTQLTDLNLTLCGSLSDEALKLFTPLTALRCLNLSRNDWLTADGLTSLHPKLFLESLDLCSCPNLVTEALPLLSQHPRLKTLNLELNDNWLKGDSLEVLIQNLPELEVLNVSHNHSFLDEDIARLAAFKKLKKLEILNCTKITAEGRKALTSQNKQLKVIFKM